MGTFLIALIWGLLAAQQPANRSSSVRSLTEQAQSERESGDFRAAERDYKAALTIAPHFAELHMNLGLVYQLENRIPGAIAEFQRALEIKPGLAGANFFLGVDYCELGEAAKAILYLKRAVREQPENKDTSFWLATAQEMAGDTQGEVQTLKRALAIHPNDPDLLYQLGGAHEQLGKEEVAALEKSAAGTFRAEQLLGESYASSSEWPLAVLHFQNAIQAAPAASVLHVELGEVYLRAGNFAKAIGEFGAELQRDPHSVRALAIRGEAELLSGDIDASLGDLSRAADSDEQQAERILGIEERDRVDSEPEIVPAETRAKLEELVPAISTRSDLGAVLALKFISAMQEDSAASAGVESDPSPPSGPLAEPCSQSELQKALAEERYSSASACLSNMTALKVLPELRIKAAEASFQMGNYEMALKVLGSLSPSDARSAEALYWRARCHEKLGAATYLKLVQANPNSYRSHQVMADLAVAKGDDASAIAEYRAALAQKPTLPGLHYSLGHLLWKDLKVADARKELEAELAINPRHEGTLLDLGDTFLLEHQGEKALPYLKRAQAIDPRNLDVHRDLGTAYFEVGDFHQAEEQFKIALPEDHDGSIHYKLARVYQSLGEKEKAAKEFAVSSDMNRESHAKLERQTDRLAEIEKSAQRR